MKRPSMASCFTYRGIFVCLIVTAITFILLVGSSFRIFVHNSSLGLTASKATDHNTRGLSVHLWDGVCVTEVKNVCKFPIFPKAPTLRVITNSSKAAYQLINTVVRMFGFIHPPLTGRYAFSLEISPQASFVFSLSTDGDPLNSRRLTGNSDQIVLQGGKEYFIELLYVQRDKSAPTAPNVAVTWQRPGENGFGVVENRFLSTYLRDSELLSRKVHDPRIPSSFVCESNMSLAANQMNSYFKWKRIEYLDHREVQDALPSCEYQPSYVIPGRKVRYRWEAINHIVLDMEIWQYPLPGSKDLGDRWDRTYALNQSTAERIVQQYMNEVGSKYPG